MGRSRHDIIIKAAAEQAKSAVKGINDQLARTRSTARRAIVVTVRASTRAARAAIRSFTTFARRQGAIITAALVIGAGGGALKAAGEYEALKLRLEGVTGSAAQAKKAFEEIFQFSTVTPFDPRELVDADIVLKSFGAGGVENLRSVANAAAIAGREIGDIVATVAGLETEPLRRLGITLKNELGSGGQAVFTFLNKAGEQIKLTADSFAEARTALLKAYDIRFGGSLAGLSESFFGLISTLRGNLGAALAEFGEGFLEPAKEFVKILNAGLVRIREDGTLRSIGEFIGGAADRLNQAFRGVGGLSEILVQGTAVLVAGVKSAGTFLQATIENIRTVFSAVFNQLRDNGIFATMGTILLEAGKGAAVVIVNTLLGAFKSAGAALASIGSVIGSEIAVAMSPVLYGLADIIKTIPGLYDYGSLIGTTTNRVVAESNLRKARGQSVFGKAITEGGEAAQRVAAETNAKNQAELAARLANIKGAVGLDGLDLRKPIEESNKIYRTESQRIRAELNQVRELTQQQRAIAEARRIRAELNQIRELTQQQRAIAEARRQDARVQAENMARAFQPERVRVRDDRSERGVISTFGNRSPSRFQAGGTRGFGNRRLNRRFGVVDRSPEGLEQERKRKVDKAQTIQAATLEEIKGIKRSIDKLQGVG